MDNRCISYYHGDSTCQSLQYIDIQAWETFLSKLISLKAIYLVTYIAMYNMALAFTDTGRAVHWLIDRVAALQRHRPGLNPDYGCRLYGASMFSQ